jgi:hypothetical protein
MSVKFCQNIRNNKDVIQAASTSETSGNYCQTSRRNISEDSHFRSRIILIQTSEKLLISIIFLHSHNVTKKAAMEEEELRCSTKASAVNKTRSRSEWSDSKWYWYSSGTMRPSDENQCHRHGGTLTTQTNWTPKHTHRIHGTDLTSYTLLFLESSSVQSFVVNRKAEQISLTTLFSSMRLVFAPYFMLLTVSKICLKTEPNRQVQVIWSLTYYTPN